MGALFICDPCDRCAYQPRQMLRYHVGDMGIFMGIATCRTCEEIMSFFPTRDNIADHAARMAGLEAPHRYLAHVQKMVAQRRDVFPDGLPLDTCSLCGSTQLYVHHIWEAQYAGTDLIQLACPRCVSGKLRLIPQGTWD
jgi:hypothetical protein